MAPRGRYAVPVRVQCQATGDGVAVALIESERL